MSYLDGLHASLWLLGALTPLAAIAVIVLALVLIDVPHRIRVLQLHRDIRRSGRAQGISPRCTCPDPEMATRSGHLRRCPLAPINLGPSRRAAADH
jgi:hypothetical protein